MASPLRSRDKKPHAGEAPDFELLWRRVPSPLLVLDAGPGFTILEASDAYLRLTRETRERIVGREFFDAFPESDSGPGKTGIASSRAALERVLTSGMDDGFNCAVRGEDGLVRYIIHRLDALDPDMVRRARERDDAVRGLERANEDLDAFVESTSQGLLGSLRAIDSFCRLFEKMRTASLDEGTRKLLMRITAQVNRMDTMIEGLLGLSRSGRSLMTRRRVDISSLARRVGDDCKARSRGRDVALRVEEGLEAWADEGLVSTALEHLMANAWKFTQTRADAAIEVGAREVSGRTVFHVKDNGVGFDMGQADKLFSPFVRLHAGADFDGHGIGLATVKRIVERHGGDLWAEANPGAGATFYFTLGGAPR